MGKDFNPENPSKYLVYLNANNLYGWAMSEPLPTKGFKWMTEEELQDWKGQGCILEVDLEYPEELHDLHNEYPLAPERLEINKVEKLIPNNASSINRHDCITFTVNTERHNIQISALYVSPSTKACISLFPEVVDSQVLVGDFNAKHKTFGSKLTLILVAELLRNLLKSTPFLFLTLSLTLFTIDLILTLISSILFLLVNLSLTLFFLVKLVLMLTVTIFLLLSNLILGQKDKL